MPELTPILTDAATLRGRVRSKVVGELERVSPVDLRGRTLELKDVRVHEREYSPDEQKHALLTGQSLTEPIKGTLVLRGADGKVVDEARNFTLTHLPWFTERHTIVMDGNEYQVANMLRRRPGAYTARASNGELKTTFNLSKGSNFHVSMDPEKGAFYVVHDSTQIPLYATLRALGVSHDDVSKSWGGKVADENRKMFGEKQEASIAKLYQKLVHSSQFDPKASHDVRLAAVVGKLGTTAMDAQVTASTLGLSHNKVTPETLLASGRKLLRVHTGDEDVDDSDSLAYKTFHSVDDFLAERVKLTAREWAPKARGALNGKDTIRGSLKPAPFSASMRKFITTSALTAVPTGINPIELIDHAVKVTALGEGGIPSERAIPFETRLTHASHFGVLDPIRTPESGHAGVDIRASIAAHRDEAGNLYSPLRNVRTGAVEFVKAGDMHNKVVAFPGQHLKGEVDVLHRGGVRKADAKTVDFEQIHVSHTYSPATSLIPLLHSIQGNRAIMGSKMQTQGLPLLKREAPLVQVKHPDGGSFEGFYGHMIVPVATVAGTVHKIEDGYVWIKPNKTKRASEKVADRPVKKEKTLGGLTFKIEIEKGESPWGDKFPADYGYLPGFDGPDGDSLDFWVGDDENGQLTAVDTEEDGEPADVKYIVGVSDAGPVIKQIEKKPGCKCRNRRDFDDWNALKGSIDEFHAVKEAGFGHVLKNTLFAGMLHASGTMPSEAMSAMNMARKAAPAITSTVTKTVPLAAGIPKFAAADERGLVKVPYQTNFPFPSKTRLHHDLSVKPGDKVELGDRLGDSNYTRSGVLATGLNARVAYMPYYGLNSNDAVVISDGFAERMTSEHMYREVYMIAQGVELSKDRHRVYFGSKYAPGQYSHLDKDGVVKKGAKVSPHDILVAGLVKAQVTGTDAMLGRISKTLTRPYREVSLTWEHGTQGEVVDVVRTPDQIAILVKTHERMQVGDKLCYDQETEVLTEHGWRHFNELNMTDRVASLENGALTFVEPQAYHQYGQGGRMYRVASQQVDLFVTVHHKMYVQKRNADEFSLYPAEEIAGQRVRYKKDANWMGHTPRYVVLPEMSVLAGQGGRGSRVLPALKIPALTYAMLLGAFLSEGNTFDQPNSGSYGIDISQVKEPNRTKLMSELRRLGVKFNEHGRGTKVRIYSKQLLEHFRVFGHSANKYIPENVFTWDRPALRVLFDWLMWGDGHAKNERPVSYTTTSSQLADDVQRLCLQIGIAGNVQLKREASVQTIRGQTYNCQPCYDVRIVTSKLRPQINHGHVHTQKTQTEEFVDNYEAPVFCVTVPSGVIYVRRNGKAVWSGNSGRYGNKGVVASIVPDDKMLKDEAGDPVELIMTSAGVVSRINPAQLHEALLGKVAEKTGKPILFDNADSTNVVEWVSALAKKHGVKEKEHLFDPVCGRKIVGPDGEGVNVGRSFIFKLFKSTDTNFAGHGVGPYDINEQPVKRGGDEGAKGLGKMEFDALVAHNARGVISDAANVRGQKNDEFWRSVQLGLPLPTYRPSFAYNKFQAMLQGAGVKVDKRGSKIHLLPMTDKDVAARSAGAVLNGQTLVAKNLKPETDGLFDPRTTGGPQGTLYSHIDLHEPVPNPVFEEPVRRLLGMTEAAFMNAVRTKGGRFIRDELGRIDVDARIASERVKLRTLKGAELNDCVKKVKYLEALKREGIKPADAYVISKIPVIPPVFRPIIPSPNDPSQLMVADANKLYGHLLDINSVVKNTVLESDVPKHREALYNAVGAVFGTHEVADQELQGQSVKGFLTQIGGHGSPKGGFFQRKLMKRQQDVSGRGTAVPDGNLHMDAVGLPEDMLWQMFDKFLVARLIRKGYGALHAKEMVEKRQPAAKQALAEEVKERPVMINRAPTLHRYGIVAAYAQPVKGKTIRVSPFVEKGMNLDYDGDTLQVHAPVTHQGIEDAKMMTMSNMLLSDQSRNRLMAYPQHEAIIGVTHALRYATNPNVKVKKFKTSADAVNAWRRGEVKQGDPVEIENQKTAELVDPLPFFETPDAD